MQVVRILIVFMSWAILVPTPFSPPDFFRTLAIFTMSMTYDWWREYDGARKDNRVIHKWYYGLSVGYSAIWLLVSFLGMFNLSTLEGEHLTSVIFFPESELKFAIPRILIVLLMLGYPIISLIEKMVPAKIRTNTEEATA